MRDMIFLKSEIEKQLTKPLEIISIVQLVDLFLEYAYVSHASDVHIHPEEKGVRLRFRIDGILFDIFPHIEVSSELLQEIITRIKVMSGLRTDEHSTPQDGRLHISIPDFGDINVRVSIIPTYHGENAILRVLAETQAYSLRD